MTPPQIPSRLWTNRSLHPSCVPTFIRNPEDGAKWLIVGRADQLTEGARVLVERFQRPDIPVRVGHVVAERTVDHRENGWREAGPVRYAMAEFENIRH